MIADSPAATPVCISFAVIDMSTGKLLPPATRLLSGAQRPLGLPSVIAVCIAFAIVLMFVGNLGPVNTDRLQMATGLVLAIVITWLLASVSRRHGLGAHVGYLTMLMGTIYWYVAPAFFLSLRTDIEVTERYGLRLRPESVGTACICIAAYTLMSVLAYWLFYVRWVKKIESVRDKKPSGLFYPAIFGLFLIGFVPYVLFGGGLENIIKALGQGRAVEAPWKSGPLGDGRSALYYISRSGMVAAAGFAGTWGVLQRSRQRGVLLGVFLATLTLVFFDGGTRSWVALGAVPTVLAWLAFRFRERMTLGNVIIAILVVSATQFTFEFARASRMLGWNRKALMSIDPLKREFDNDFFSELVVSVDLVPQRHSYFYLDDLWAFVAHPVPRALWSGKPISPVLSYYNDVVADGILARANKLPSHIGQFYMSFGYVGVVLLGLLSGMISAIASALMQSRHVRLAHVGGAIAAWWFLMGRGVYPAWSYVVLFALAISIVGFRTAVNEDFDELQTEQYLNS